MAASLLSSSWYRVADRRPKLRAHARLYRHSYRGQVWHLLQDPASARVHRFDPSARLIIGLMDGRRSVADLWALANRRLGERAPTQDEMIRLLGQLHAADLLQSDATPDVTELSARGAREERARLRRSFANPMAVRLPLWDPDRFLNRIAGALRWIWSGWGAALWIAVVVPALWLASSHWPELTNNLADRVLAIDKLFALFFVFCAVKALHEFGHATAVKAGGGEVHDMGLMLLVFLPVPYVEASASTVFRSKYRRALVGAAGVAVELFAAAIAFYVWLLVEPGLVRALAFQTMVVASVSTVVFNGNPLLRYDAYYVLADLIEIPNLAARSSSYWGYLIERYVLGAVEVESPEGTGAEKAWFVFYGFASTLYRIFVTLVIALFIAGRFFLVGVALALWAIGGMAVLPAVKSARHLAGSPHLRKRRLRAVLVGAGLTIGLGVLLLLVPAPSHSHAEGVVWLPEQAILRAGANGFLQTVLVEPGGAVSKGDAVAVAVDPVLGAKLRLHEAKVAELQAEYSAQFVSDRAKAQIVRQRIDSELAAGALARERAADLIVRAKADGVLTIPQIVDLPGRYFKRGDLLGYVLGQTQPLARVVVTQDVVDRVRLDTRQVRVRVVDRPEIVWAGRLVREVPAAGEYLPSRALAVDGGGEVATDPRDPKGARALQRMFQFDVEIAGLGNTAHFGQRVLVRFEHGPEPLALQWYRTIRLLFLSSFSV